MDLEKLQEAEEAARKVLDGIETEKRDFISAKDRETRDEAESIYGERIQAAREALHAAREVTLAEQEAIAQTGNGAPLPLGTKVYKWEQTRAHKWDRNLVWKVTATGIVEAITRESEHPQNLHSYSRAKVGDFVVRLHKKDGTLGARYDRTFKNAWSGEGWYEDGVNAPKFEN